MAKLHARCFKYCLIAINLVFTLLGLVILMLGFWFRYDQRTRTLFEVDKSAEQFSIGIYVMWAAGSLLLVAGFTGYLSITREHRCLIWIYFGILILLFLIEMGVAIWAFVQKDQVIKQLQDAYANTVINNKDDVDLNCLLSAVQKTMDCCDKGSKDCSSRTYEDCKEAIKEMINSKLHIFAAIAFGIALFTVLGIILTILFQRSFRRSLVI
ncbi:CD9 antigen-like [Hemitrygon akajei]|uniref:CD9 antigen-like n=1 Tax=Hemitrygon akajei TaxID=2704970 RepID=UPI003BF97E1E